MVLVEISCAFCREKVDKPAGEVKRSRKRSRPLFCSRSCSAKAANAPRKAVEITKACPTCGKTFRSSTHAKAATYCSRSCASKGSMSESRRAAQRAGGKKAAGNLLPLAEVLKRREAWKYVDLQEVLISSRRAFEFEYAVGGYVFDLALLDEKVLVEFDGAMK